MRALALLVASLFAFGALAGCMGAAKDDPPVDPTKASLVDPPVGGGQGASFTIRAPLASTVSLDAPAWIQSGTEVPVKATPPTGAKGALTYTWAVGPLPGTSAVTPVPMDTGTKVADLIQPGKSKSLTFATAGVYALHCHPHPAMRHNVTVIDGYAGPKTVEVSIVDGATAKEYLYYPENIVVGVGTTVVYKNVGAQPHTATGLGAQEPALKALPLKTEAGSVKIEGNGWVRVLAIVQDAQGGLGFANQSIYVTPTLPAFATKTVEMTFTAGTPAPLAGTPAEAASQSEPVVLEQGGLVTINYTFADGLAGAGAPENLAQVEVHFTKDGETQDTLTSSGDDSAGSLSGKAIAGAYTLTVIAKQGVEVTGTLVIDVVYDLVPPPPAAPTAAGGHDDSGGGHAH